MILRLHSEVLEYRIGPEALHEILLAVSNESTPTTDSSLVPSYLFDRV